MKLLSWYSALLVLSLLFFDAFGELVLGVSLTASHVFEHPDLAVDLVPLVLGLAAFGLSLSHYFFFFSNLVLKIAFDFFFFFFGFECFDGVFDSLDFIFECLLVVVPGLDGGFDGVYLTFEHSDLIFEVLVLLHPPARVVLDVEELSVKLFVLLLLVGLVSKLIDDFGESGVLLLLKLDELLVVGLICP